MGLSDVARVLLDEFVAVYRPTMEERIVAGGFAVSTDVESAISQGEEWLRAELAELLETPFLQQQRSPLELFQDAARFPTEALSAEGAAPIWRDHVSRSALPGDLFGLAPASSQDMTSDAWRAHLAWGAAKAQAMAHQVRRPMAGVYSRNLLDRSKLEMELRAAGYDAFLLRNLELTSKAMSGKRPPVAFVDLENQDADEVIRVLSDNGVAVVAYGPHVDDLSMQRARGLGASAAVARSRLFGRVADHLPQIV